MNTTINAQQILAMMPHRYPILLVERLENIIPGESATGHKCVSINEPFFQGHFPGHPIMPGVLIIEAMAQTAGALVLHTMGKDAYGKLVYFMSIEAAKFRKPVLPGDVLKLHVTKHNQRRNIWKFEGIATVEGKTVAEAMITAMIQDGSL
jgi:3-hydroxyacyl-[acyl-carrier-protein] dehydratase